jgi:hypothetical protein
MKNRSFFVIIITLILPFTSFAERTIIVKGLYITHTGPNPGPTGDVNIKITCALVSESTCYVITSQSTLSNIEAFYLTNDDFEPNEPITIKLNDGTEISGTFKNYANEPANSNNYLERNHIITIH